MPKDGTVHELTSNVSLLTHSYILIQAIEVCCNGVFGGLSIKKDERPIPYSRRLFKTTSDNVFAIAISHTKEDQANTVPYLVSTHPFCYVLNEKFLRSFPVRSLFTADH